MPELLGCNLSPCVVITALRLLLELLGCNLSSWVVIGALRLLLELLGHYRSSQVIIGALRSLSELSAPCSHHFDQVRVSCRCSLGAQLLHLLSQRTRSKFRPFWALLLRTDVVLQSPTPPTKPYSLARLVKFFSSHSLQLFSTMLATILLQLELVASGAFYFGG